VAADNVERSVIIEGVAISRYARSTPVNVIEFSFTLSPGNACTPSFDGVDVPSPVTSHFHHAFYPPNYCCNISICTSSPAPGSSTVRIATESIASWICDRPSAPSAHDSTLTPPTGGAAPSGLVASI